MRGEAVAGRYAKALFESITEQAGREQASTALTRVAASLAEPAGPRTIILNPFYTKPQREAALQKLIEILSRETAIPPAAARFLQLLLRKNRLDVASAIAVAFERLLVEAQGRVSLTVSTAKPLDTEAQRLLQARLEQALKRPVGLAFDVEPGLLGGLRLQLGSRLIDGTVRGQLDRIRRQVLKTSA
ncbi:MAG: ATP synthase F1 subunit delta [Nitrospirota bacterium]